MTAPTPPEATAELYRQGQALSGALVLSVRALWPRFDPARIEGSFSTLLPSLVALFGSAQASAARGAETLMPQALEQVGLRSDPGPAIRPQAFIGSSSGVALEDMLVSVPIQAFEGSQRGLSRDELSGEALRRLEGMAVTQVADAARAASSVAIATRPWVTGYVRMLNPPACDRCVILAGKFFLWNAGFPRHPRCDCRHIPADEDTADNYLTDPDAYFKALSEEEQDRLVGKANAEAIRDGADMGQIINARRDTYTAQVYGQRVRATYAGTSSRGVFGRQQRDLAKQQGQRYRRSRTPRLMPESIYRIAKDREDAIRLLRFYGFIY